MAQAEERFKYLGTWHDIMVAAQPNCHDISPTSHETHDSLASRRLDAHNYCWRDYQTENLLGFGTGHTHRESRGSCQRAGTTTTTRERVMRKELQVRTEGDVRQHCERKDGTNLEGQARERSNMAKIDRA